MVGVGDALELFLRCLLVRVTAELVGVVSVTKKAKPRFDFVRGGGR